MGDCVRFACGYTGQLLSTGGGLAGGTAVFYLLAVLLGDGSDLLTLQRIEFIFNYLEDTIRTGADAISTAIAFLSVDSYEVVAGAVFVAIVR